MLDVVSRSQRGRACEYRRGGAVLRTPAVVGPEGPVSMSLGPQGRTLRVMGAEVPLDGRILVTESSGRPCPPSFSDGVAVVRLPLPEGYSVPEGAEILVAANAFELRKDPRRLVDAMIALREAAGYGALLFVPGLADPSNMALLAYMGADLFDDAFARASGRFGVRTAPEGGILADGDPSEANVAEMARECALVADFISAGRLRELVDQRAPSSPSSVAALRIFDDRGYAFQEAACPTVGTRFCCNTTQSLRRPEVARYRRAFMERYRRPAHKRILLLLPCSAKKPYHASKSHRLFASAIHTAGHDTVVHEAIVTSPLGVVPRELDVFFPANSYDIPVTGEWKCEERAFIREMLAHLLESEYDAVVSHLGADTALIEGLCDPVETCVGDPTSPASLERLDSTLRSLAAGMEHGDYMVDRKETLRSVLSFQFGPDAADLIMDADTFGIGKFPYWKIMRGKTQLGMLTEERSMVSLTLDGAKVLAAAGVNVVEMGDFELSGSLFAVGVAAADPRIRIGDEAVVTCRGEVRGVGVAMMSGPEMLGLSRGVAVKIRHKAKRRPRGPPQSGRSAHGLARHLIFIKHIGIPLLTRRDPIWRSRQTAFMASKVFLKGPSSTLSAEGRKAGGCRRMQTQGTRWPCSAVSG